MIFLASTGQALTFFALAILLTEYLIACSIIVEYESTAETSVVINFAIPYFSLSVSLTVIATALIIARLMAGRRSVQKALRTNDSVPYVSVAAMLVESAALYTIVGIFFIALLCTENPGQNVLNPMVGQAMVRHPCSPLSFTIIYYF